MTTAVPRPLTDAAHKLRTAARLIGEVWTELGTFADRIEPTSDKERLALLEWPIFLERFADMLEAPWGSLPGEET